MTQRIELIAGINCPLQVRTRKLNLANLIEIEIEWYFLLNIVSRNSARNRRIFRRAHLRYLRKNIFINMIIKVTSIK